ncbi:MAG: hypothetical protein IPK17_30350 [Chloroflexi bacterium]|uniref:hypothetical protein n=1 Tax=Candidatus Flexifilum breve TaxID=3140694 RepID=UPI003135BEF4|nr:hypothetical protein [Chloroflexota bacterium]
MDDLAVDDPRRPRTRSVRRRGRELRARRAAGYHRPGQTRRDHFLFVAVHLAQLVVFALAFPSANWLTVIGAYACTAVRAGDLGRAH